MNAVQCLCVLTYPAIRLANLACKSVFGFFTTVKIRCGLHVEYFVESQLGRTPRGSCNRTLLRRVLRRFSKNKRFLEGFLEGAL